MNAFNRLVTLVGTILPTILLGVVLVAVSADVFARLLLSTSIHVSHDIAMIALAGVVWFGIVGSAQEGQLFGLRYFVDRVPKRGRPWMAALGHLLVAAIAFEVMRAAFRQASTGGFTRFLALGWPKWIVSAGLAGAMAALIAIQLVQLWAVLRSRSRK
ncbi:TRAP transporter small permease [Paracoccus rhizosphaerae]|uniref:TRAP transporter small permease protein n=1 Tax=Paracoccus rhizosphaerae TaxID=1133347 RepID=A0ABV6CIF9_9RHOB|nr:TRAP transporter small permease subunit [Paracoccus rhizosphaerae]